jgi:hypothetical protein
MLAVVAKTFMLDDIYPRGKTFLVVCLVLTSVTVSVCGRMLQKGEFQPYKSKLMIVVGMLLVWVSFFNPIWDLYVSLK